MGKVSDVLDEVKITKGMANAGSQHLACKSCGLKIPRYPGRYPKKCPDCGGEIAQPEAPKKVGTGRPEDVVKAGEPATSAGKPESLNVEEDKDIERGMKAFKSLPKANILLTLTGKDPIDADQSAPIMGGPRADGDPLK